MRVGNVLNHKDKHKQTGDRQSWFPKNWSRQDIKKAGQAVAKGRKLLDGKTKIGRTRGVDVGIMRTHGKIATIFPLNQQYIKYRRKHKK